MSMAPSKHYVESFALLECVSIIPISVVRGWTPLHCSCYKGHLDVARFLCDNGADSAVANK